MALDDQSLAYSASNPSNTTVSKETGLGSYLAAVKSSLYQLQTDLGTQVGSLTTEINNLNATLTALIAQNTPTGIVATYFGKVAPTGWLLLNGQSVSIVTYSNLYNWFNTQGYIGSLVIVTGSSMALPDVTKKFIIAADGVTYTIGSTGGAAQVALSVNNLAAHTHVNTAFATVVAGALSEVGTPSVGLAAAGSTGSTGSGTPFSILPPYYALTMMIKD